MEKKSDFICSFNQKLSYDDYLNFNKYTVNATYEKFKAEKYSPEKIMISLIQAVIILISLSFAFIMVTTNDNTIQRVALISFILIIIFLKLLSRYRSMEAKKRSLESVERKFVLFEDYFLYNPINSSNDSENDNILIFLLRKFKVLTPNIKEYKVILQDISEIILTSEFCTLKANDTFFIVSLSKENPEINTMINYLKSNYPNKFITNWKNKGILNAFIFYIINIFNLSYNFKLTTYFLLS